MNALLTQPLNRRTYWFASSKCLHGPLVDLEAFLTQLDDLLYEGRRYNDHTVFIADQDIIRIYPEIALELQGYINLRGTSERVRSEDRGASCEDLSALLVHA